MIKRYKSDNYREELFNMVNNNDFVQKIKMLLKKYIIENDFNRIKDLCEEMWCQHIISNKIERLIKNLKNGNLEENIQSWVLYWKKYYELGFSYCISC